MIRVRQLMKRDSNRKDKNFIAVNCAALPESLLESELFGHKRGSYTGATFDKKGLFEEADGGTLYLDEIGDLSLSIQVKLLRVLEVGTFRPVGSTQEKKVDVRIIAATNKDLKQLIDKGRFREDLYYRINVININLPPLRERKEDIPLLADHFIREANGQQGAEQRLSDKALKLLMEYNYPGNVRELRNIIERSLMLCENNLIRCNDLPLEVDKDIREDQKPSDDKEQPFTLGGIKERTERDIILQALKQVNGNKLKAAKLLNISRSTLYAKIEKYQIET